MGLEFQFEDDVFEGIQARLGREPLWKSFYFTGLTLMAERSDRPLEFFRTTFIPWFFSRFPEGRIDFLEPIGPFSTRMHAIRKVVQITDDPVSATMVDPPATLAKLHGLDTVYWPRDEVLIWGSLLWPYIMAIPINLVTCGLVFHLGELWDTREPQPSSLDRWWRNENHFQEERDNSEIIRMARGEASLPFFGDARTIISQLSSPTTFERYLERISSVRELIADFRVFANPSSRTPDFLQNLQLLLTFQRVVATTHYLSNYEPPFIAKGLLFDLADQYATMTEQVESDQAGRFEWLFDSSQGGQWTSSALKKIPEIGDYLGSKAEQLYVLLDASIDAGLKKRISTPRPHLIRHLRNARHGYWFRGPAMQDLANYDANLSDDATQLAALWWLAFLEEPWQMIRRDADSGLLHRYGSTGHLNQH